MPTEPVLSRELDLSDVHKELARRRDWERQIEAENQDGLSPREEGDFIDDEWAKGLDCSDYLLYQIYPDM